MLIPVAIAQMFNAIAELVIPIGIWSKKAKAKTEVDTVIVRTKIDSVQYSLELCKPFCAFYSSVHFALFL